MGQKRAVLVASMMSFQKIYGLHGLDHQIIENSKKEKVITGRQTDKRTDKQNFLFRLDPFCRRGRVEMIKYKSSINFQEWEKLLHHWTNWRNLPRKMKSLRTQFQNTRSCIGLWFLKTKTFFMQPIKTAVANILKISIRNLEFWIKSAFLALHLLLLTSERGDPPSLGMWRIWTYTPSIFWRQEQQKSGTAFPQR